MSYFTDNELEKEKLQEFTTPQGQEELYNYCNRPRRTILEVLTDFPHATANLSLEYLFEIFSPIRPRAFSIASAPSVCFYSFTYRSNIYFNQGLHLIKKCCFTLLSTKTLYKF